MVTAKPKEPGEPRQRLFVALDLPDAVRQGIDAWSGRELSDPGLRRVAPESLHVTLAFLGQRPAAEAEAIAAAVAAAGSPAPALELLDPVPRPARGRPHFYALPARSAAAVELQSDLQSRLVDAGLYEPDKRPFWPHVTVARARAEGRGSRRPAVVEKRPGALPPTLREPFLGVRVTLYRSELQPRGARYVPLAQVELS
jgi:2'-5' RNA ligase